MNTTPYFDIYEVRAFCNHIVTSAEASSNTIKIPNIEPHAIALTYKEYTRAYGERSDSEFEKACAYAIATMPKYGSLFDIRCPTRKILSDITETTYDSPDTTVTFDNLTKGEEIDVYLPVTNALPLSDVQFGISYNMDAYYEEADVESHCGSISMQSPIGNNDLRKFLATFAGKGNDVICNKIWLLDVISPTLRHDIFYEVYITGYGQTKRGEMIIKFTFAFP